MYVVYCEEFGIGFYHYTGSNSSAFVHQAQLAVLICQHHARHSSRVDEGALKRDFDLIILLAKDVFQTQISWKQEDELMMVPSELNDGEMA